MSYSGISIKMLLLALSDSSLSVSAIWPGSRILRVMCRNSRESQDCGDSQSIKVLHEYVNNAPFSCLSVKCQAR